MTKPTTSGPLYLGVDAGVTRTTAAIADQEGRILGLAKAGGAKTQLVGLTAARQELKAAIDGALNQAEVTAEQIESAALGVAGYHPANFDPSVWAAMEQVLPAEQRFVERRAVMALRAGTKDAVGAALLVGIETECVARDRYGRRHQIGGFGPLSGDVGFTEDLAMRTIGGAWMASDGRAGPSNLIPRVCEVLGVDTVQQAPRVLVRGELPLSLARKLVAALFTEAEGGDGLAQRLIEDTGSRLGASAAAALRALSLRSNNAVVVLGGSGFFGAERQLLVQAVERRVLNLVPEAYVRFLETEPVVGAVLMARDLVSHAPLDFARRLRQELPQKSLSR